MDLRMSLLFETDIHRPNTMAHKHLRMSQFLRLLVRLGKGTGPAVVNRAISTNMRTSLRAADSGGVVYRIGLVPLLFFRTFGAPMKIGTGCDAFDF
jgi:hypothetical protein